MKLALVCIASKEYLPRYKVLFDSVKRVNPFIKQILYQVSGDRPEWADEVVDVSHLMNRYNRIEQNICSIRPWVVLDAFQKGYDIVGHLGADVEFFNDFTYEVLGYHYKALVIPHITQPLPDDGKFPFLEGVARTGLINSDCIFFKNCPEIVDFLNWQSKRLETMCVQNDYHFLDQTSLNFLPAFVDDVVWLRHAGWNVAYWNVYERGLKKREDGAYFMGNGEPLVCFQYSGLDFQVPERLSVHQNRHTAEGLVLELLSDYVKKVTNEQ